MKTVEPPEYCIAFYSTFMNLENSSSEICECLSSILTDLDDFANDSVHVDCDTCDIVDISEICFVKDELMETVLAVALALLTIDEDLEVLK